MNVDEAAEQLYGLPAGEFVSARDAMAKQAKSAGERDVAARIGALRKPTVTAWLVNQLAREHSSDLAALDELGAQMREATAAHDGSRVRELTSQRKELVDSLVRRAREIATRAGQRMSADMAGEVNDTLFAAVADPDAAAALRAGRLTHALQHVGYGPVDVAGEPAEVISLSAARTARGQPEQDTPTEVPADPDTDATTERERQSANEVELREAEQELEQAELAVTGAERRVGDLSSEVDDRRQALERAEAAVEQLAAQLDAARRELEQARTEVRQSEDELDQAYDDVKAARRRRREAERRV